MQKIVLIILLFVAFQFKANASHIRGGAITYECIGGNYVFQLIVYRDCNNAELSNISQQLQVWNHPVLSSITLNFISRTDISPAGTQVVGGPSCYSCGVGAAGGNGLGAIEKFIYRSAPINISGVPPPNGWIFTFDNFSRSASITNLQNSDTYGITLVATIFNVGNTNNVCVDNSAQFLQEPHFVSCAGKPFTMNLNAVDPDLDSIAISFAQPLNNILGATYNPPTDPLNVPFMAGFNANSPTPSPAINPGNISAQVDPSSGEITFTSFTTGSFVIKLKARSYRNGILISEVENEVQIEVTTCLVNNNPPTIIPPFAGLFETTVVAGDLVNFNLSSVDPEFLQDGTPQQNYMNPTGLLFGTNSTATTGCIITPCATVSSTPLITGIQGATTTFNWQTDCDHVVNSDGTGLDVVPYHFVFRVQDDFCPVPEVVYATVTINVVNPNIIQAPNIECIQGDAAGNFTLTWQAVTDVGGSFVEYQIHSVQNGLLATLPAIGTTTYTHVGATQATDYFIAVVSGCNGNTSRNSDTIRSIYLDVDDLNPGTAVLNWNRPSTNPLPGMATNYDIYREYPAGVWTLVGSTTYNNTTFQQEIDICNIALNYQIVLQNTFCNYSSQVDGGNFNDQTPPSIPTVGQVTFDTLTGETTITWNQNDKPDTDGYLIYVVDPNTGFLVELDTIYGIGNTSYTYFENYTNGAMTYTVAAFDSCPSNTGAPFNLSARDPNFHSTIYLTAGIDICSSGTILNWTNYVGWTSGVQSYNVFVKPTGGVWTMVSSTTSNSFSYQGIPGQTYDFVIKANHADGRFSFSNTRTLQILGAPTPSYSYIQTATVQGDEFVEIHYAFDPNGKVSKIVLERQKKDGSFEELETIENPNASTVFVDKDVEVDALSYTYRVMYYDSCGNAGTYSNIGKTILLEIQTDNTKLINYLTWNAYQDFNGSVTAYSIYRGIDGIIDPTPIALINSAQRSYVEDMSDWEFTGKVCYVIEAIEGSNIFNDPRFSYSNIACAVVEPLIFIPNAFMPTGVNSVFRPVITNFDSQDYKMTIFDRWGQVVFQTTNYLEGWNGRLNNIRGELEGGTYVYMIEVHDGGGSEYMQRGHVTLLR